MTRVSFGIKTAPQHTTYQAMLQVWREADEIAAFEHAWLFDHFAPIWGTDLDGPCFEGWTLLTALAVQTRRLRVGLMVTGNTYRHPAVLAHIAATLDVLCNGRLDFGIGAGWNEYEHRSMGIELYEPAERIRRLGEACELTKLLWTQRLTTFDGRYYQLADARCEPKPVQQPYPPFVIGGSGEQLTLRVVARHADVWNFVGGTVEQFVHKSAVLDRHCHAIGRDPGTIARSIQLPVDLENPAAAAATTQPYVDAGANHVVYTLRYPYPEHAARLVADEVIARVKEPG